MTRRVAHVLRKLDPTEWGGTETHVYEITRRLPDHDYRPEVHAPALRSRDAIDEGILAPDIPLSRYRAFLPFVGLPHRRRALLANGGNIASVDEPLRLARDRGIDLAHLHTMGRIGGAVRTAMRLTARPYVLSIHGPFLASREWLEQDTRHRMRGALDLGKPIGLVLRARRVVDDAARIIVFNEEERVALAQRVGDRVVRMDHGVDEERLSSGDAARARERWPALADVPIVAVVGRLCGQKNQLLAVRAFANGAPPDHHLVLAGAATDHGYREQIQREAKRLEIAERVHVLGNLNARTEIPDLYALARALLVTSQHEAFGLIVLEGWASGTPVLFPRHSGLADIAAGLRDPEGVVPSLDAGEWSDKLARALTSEEMRRANVEAGRALIRQRYNWDSIAARLASLYDEVIEEQRRAGGKREPRVPATPAQVEEWRSLR